VGVVAYSIASRLLGVGGMGIISGNRNK
jgi:hypothetical protein